VNDEFDMYSFLNNFSGTGVGAHFRDDHVTGGGGEDVNGPQTAFLDAVPSPSENRKPPPGMAVLPPSLKTIGVKRRSDVVVGEEQASVLGGPTPKKRGAKMNGGVKPTKRKKDK
jgi:hypothetical protein